MNRLKKKIYIRIPNSTNFDKMNISNYIIMPVAQIIIIYNRFQNENNKYMFNEIVILYKTYCSV